jgi:hypothetical protein
MKVLSIDIGIKNLAFCLLEKNNVEDGFKIKSWDVVNICEMDTFICGFIDKKGIKCTKNAKYKKNDCFCCIKHSKKQTYDIPNKELTSLSKNKIGQLQTLADKYNIVYSPHDKKPELLKIINDHVKANCFDEIKTTNASRVDLITIGTNIKTKFDILFSGEEVIDYVIIENQISPIANRMKSVQGMVTQYFIMCDIFVENIEFVSSINKIKDLNTNELEGCKGGGKINYKDRKQLGIKKCTELITTDYHFNDQIAFFDSHKKKDDLSDSFLQGMWYISSKKL